MKTTILYLSGAGRKIEECISERPEDFPNVGVLLSFWDLRKGGRAVKRLKTLTAKENIDESEA